MQHLEVLMIGDYLSGKTIQTLELDGLCMIVESLVLDGLMIQPEIILGPHLPI